MCTCTFRHTHGHPCMQCTPPFAYTAFVYSLCNTLSCGTLCSERMERLDREEIWREQTHVIGTALLCFPLSEPPCRQGTELGGGRGRAGRARLWWSRCVARPQCWGCTCSAAQAACSAPACSRCHGPACQLSPSLSRLAREAGKEQSVFSWDPSKTRIGGEH